MVHVLCFGNLLHGDDGFGIHVHRVLAERSVFGKARLIEAGIRGMDVLAMLDHPSHVVLVDALRDPHSPAGTVHVVDAADLDTDRSESVHGGGVAWLIRAIRAMAHPAPRVTLVGAVASGIHSYVPELSPALADRVGEVATLVEQLAHGTHAHG